MLAHETYLFYPQFTINELQITLNWVLLSYTSVSTYYVKNLQSEAYVDTMNVLFGVCV